MIKEKVLFVEFNEEDFFLFFVMVLQTINQ